MGSLSSYYIFYTWILAGVFFAYYLLKDRHKLPLPPGPKSLPFIGTAFNLTSSHEYGDVVHVTALGKHIIILNSTKACVNLLEQWSAIYSDRPSLPMLHKPAL
ncbi:hypothetical protein M422DRAFT_158612 [Sphaerobolus stellatus SS14]|nr:hypothetical protein M422DRAFT_158612 [Sphaerobolus stellatus SS14]